MAVAVASAVALSIAGLASTACGGFDSFQGYAVRQATRVLDRLYVIVTPTEPTPVSHVRYSPDGKQIFYVRGFHPAVKAHLCVRSGDAEDERVIETVRGPGTETVAWGLAVSPTGERLAVAKGGPLGSGAQLAIYDTVTLEKTEEHEIGYAGDIGWSPDGRSIWINGGGTRLLSLDPGTTTPDQRGGFSGRLTNLYPADSTDSAVIGCSPEGEYFIRRLTHEGNYRIHRTASDVIGGFGKSQPECLLFDGERIICAVNDPGTRSAEVTVIRPSTDRTTLWTGRTAKKGEPVWIMRMVWERPGETLIMSIHGFYEVPKSEFGDGSQDALVRLNVATGEAETLGHIVGMGDWDYSPATKRLAHPAPDGSGVLERTLE